MKAESVISLSSTMQRRMNFMHPLMDLVDDYKVSREETLPLVELYLKGDLTARDDLIMGYMWLAKDVVSRFRAHWSQTIPMTDDLVSEAILALTEYVDGLNNLQEGLDDQQYFFNKAQYSIHDRLRDYINDYRSIISASRDTNYRRLREDKPLEYVFAEPICDDLMGEEDLNPCFVDILDSLEALRGADKEEMDSLVKVFLQRNHNIDEDSLSDDERAAIEKLSSIVVNL